MSINQKDVGAGAFFIVIGLLYGGQAWFRLPIGVALSMGPGYFPIVLSGALVVFGLVLAGRGLITGPGTPFGVVPWRSVFMLSLATIIFAAFVEVLGMLPGVFVTSFVATLANPKVRIVNSIPTSIGIAIFCTVVFDYGVRLPVPVIGPWLSW